MAGGRRAAARADFRSILRAAILDAEYVFTCVHSEL